MSEARRAGGVPLWVGPIAAVMLMQGMGGVLLQLQPTLGPLLMATYGYSTTTVGLLTTIAMSGAVVCLILCNALIRAVGPLRTSQFASVLAAAGVLLLIVPVWQMPIIASAVIGVAYGTFTPTGSDVLQRFAPRRQRGLVFSLKQAIVPVAGAGAGLTLPAVAEWGGLSAAAVLCAVLMLAAAVLSQAWQRRSDGADRVGVRHGLATSLSRRNLVAPLTAVRLGEGLRRLSLVGMLMGLVHGTLMALLVTTLVRGRGFDLTAAGALFAVFQIGGLSGRIVLGFLTDRLGSAMVTMRIAMVGAAAMLLVLAIVPAATSFLTMTVLMLVLGMFASGWNGVQLAEIARRAPDDMVSEATSGATIATFVGFLAGPLVFSAVLVATDSFAWPVVALALAAAAAFVLSFGDGDRLTAPA